MKTEMLIAMDGIAAASGGGEDGEGGSGGGDGDGGSDDDGEDAAASAASKMVMVLGATNQPWELDDAFKRRFEKRIYIPLPGPEERKALFRLCLKDIRMADDVDLEALAAATEHYSGADLAVVAKHAAYAPMRHKQAEVAKLFPRPDQVRDRIAAIQAAEWEVKTAPIHHGDLMDAVGANKPSASNENLKRFEEYAADHGAS